MVVLRSGVHARARARTRVRGSTDMQYQSRKLVPSRPSRPVGRRARVVSSLKPVTFKLSAISAGSSIPVGGWVISVFPFSVSSQYMSAIYHPTLWNPSPSQALYQHLHVYGLQSWTLCTELHLEYAADTGHCSLLMVMSGTYQLCGCVLAYHWMMTTWIS